MSGTTRNEVQSALADAAAAHASLLAKLPEDLQASLPVDAQGVTQAIDLLATAAGLTDRERRDLVRPHALNPAVLHARVFGRAPLSRETVIASFVDGARVRADALTALADEIGGAALGREIRRLLVAHPLPGAGDGDDAVPALEAAYAAHERAALTIAEHLDADDGGANAE